MSGYNQIKTMAKEQGLNITDFIVLARKNDPYYSGSPAQVKEAEWFGTLWNTYNNPGTHIRRIHYWAQALKTVVMPNGQIYENIKSCWKTLCQASKHARYLNHVDPRHFVDNRNAEMQHNADHDFDAEPYYELFAGGWTLPRPSDLSFNGLNISTPDIYGYDYDHGAQKYLLALFIEKSTMDDILVPVCRQYGLTYLQGTGFTSITRLIELLDLSQQTGKPVRIFYISDYDNAGKAMPIAAARQLQYWADQDGIYSSIKLNPIGLTAEQIDQYDLPTAPDKDDVELDALEALHPGKLAEIVRHAIQPYFDTTLRANCLNAENEAQESVDEQWEDFTSDIRNEAEDLEARIKEVYKKYVPEIAALTEKMNEELDPLDEEKAAIEEQLEKLVEEFDPELPDRPEPDVEEQDEEDWLYDSDRSYGAQTYHFKYMKAVA